MSLKNLKIAGYTLLVFLALFILSAFVMLLSGNVWVQICSLFPIIGAIGSSFLEGVICKEIYYKTSKENKGR